MRFYSWLLLMFVNLNRKTEKKPNTSHSFLAVFGHVLIFERKVNFMVVLSNIKHNLVSTTSSLCSNVRLFGLLYVISVLENIYVLPCGTIQNYSSKSLWWNMRKHVFFLCGN